MPATAMTLPIRDVRDDPMRGSKGEPEETTLLIAALFAVRFRLARVAVTPGCRADPGRQTDDLFQGYSICRAV